MIFESWKNPQDFEVSTDPSKVDLDKLHYFLSKESYWAKNMPKQLVVKAVNNSINFSLTSPEGKFIGYARVVSDCSTFAWLADVFIDAKFRGKGLGKFLMESVHSHTELQGLRIWLLLTKDAHTFYRKCGWNSMKKPESAMEIRHPSSELYSS